jgi:hypothetical protein
MMGSLWVVAILCTLALVFSSGCSSKLEPEEYIEYINREGDKFCKTVERNGFITTVCHRPNEYYAAQEMRIDSTLTVQETLNKYQNTVIFTCEVIAKDNSNSGRLLLQGNGFADYGKNVNKNTFGKKDDIFLVNGNDTVQIAEYQYERNWGTGNGDVFVMSFPIKELRPDLKKYHLIIRNLIPEIGTIDIHIADVMRRVKGLKD